MRSSPVGWVAMDLASAPAYGRKKRDFVAGIKRSVPGSEFLVPGRYQRTTVAGEFRAARNKLREEVFYAGAGCELHRFLRTSCNFLKPAEKKDLYADCRFYVGWCHAAHTGIVTRGGPRA